MTSMKPRMIWPGIRPWISICAILRSETPRSFASNLTAVRPKLFEADGSHPLR